MKMKTKKPILLLLTLLLIPLVYAEEECGITNLASCIPQKLFEYLLNIINAPFQPFLEMTKSLLTEPVDIQVYIPIWAIIIYIISIFFSLFLLLVGFNFIISGYSAEKRENAKEWLKNVILMIFFVQASSFLYSVAIDLSCQLTIGVYSLIDPNFFQLGATDNFTSFSVQLVLSVLYLLSLVICILLLAIRYLFVAMGVIFFPIGIFFNFIPFLKSYGQLIINTLLIAIFLPFFLSLILLGSSMLLDLPMFADNKMIVMISAFALVSITVILLAVFAVMKATIGVLNSNIGKGAKLMIGGV